MTPRKPKQRDGSEANPFVLDAYLRVSLREQAEEGYSLEAQERAFREWQEEEARHGRHWLIRFHVEPGASAHTEVLEKRRQAQTGYRCRCRELNDDLCPCRSRILPSYKIIAQFSGWLERHTRLPDDWQEKIRSRLLEQAALALGGSERADILGEVRRKEAELERIKDMYQLGDIDRSEYLARMRDVQAVLVGLRQRVQLESVDARVKELTRAAMELIDLASDWRDANALKRAEATQALVEAVSYDPLEQCIVGVSIRQKYRSVLVSASGDETQE